MNRLFYYVPWDGANIKKIANLKKIIEKILFFSWPQKQSPEAMHAHLPFASYMPRHFEQAKEFSAIRPKY